MVERVHHPQLVGRVAQDIVDVGRHGSLETDVLARRPPTGTSGVRGPGGTTRPAPACRPVRPRSPRWWVRSAGPARRAAAIDVETGELHPGLTDGQRAADLDDRGREHRRRSVRPPARRPVGRRHRPVRDRVESSVATSSCGRAHRQESCSTPTRRYRIEQRDPSAPRPRLRRRRARVQAGRRWRSDPARPRVVEIGYYAPRLAALTGLHTGENQARRLLNDIRPVPGLELERAATVGASGEDGRQRAGWTRSTSRRCMRSPRNCRRSWSRPSSSTSCSSTAGSCRSRPSSDVGIEVAVPSYVDNVLRARPRRAPRCSTRRRWMPIIVAGNSPAADDDSVSLLREILGVVLDEVLDGDRRSRRRARSPPLRAVPRPSSTAPATSAGCAGRARPAGPRRARPGSRPPRWPRPVRRFSSTLIRQPEVIDSSPTRRAAPPPSSRPRLTSTASSLVEQPDARGS